VSQASAAEGEEKENEQEAFPSCSPLVAWDNASPSSRPPLSVSPPSRHHRHDHHNSCWGRAEPQSLHQSIMMIMNLTQERIPPRGVSMLEGMSSGEDARLSRRAQDIGWEHVP
jgi:hypothetical protein